MQFTTRNRTYLLLDIGDGGWLIKGHPEYCPLPTLCQLAFPVKVGERVRFKTHAGWVITTAVESIVEES